MVLCGSDGVVCEARDYLETCVAARESKVVEYTLVFFLDTPYRYSLDTVKRVL